MPTYDYQCRACGAVTEVIHAMTEDGPSVCEQCGGELRRVLYPAGIIFKGSGFYRTDSRSSSSSSVGGAGSNGGGAGSTESPSKGAGSESSSSTSSEGKTKSSGGESAA